MFLNLPEVCILRISNIRNKYLMARSHNIAFYKVITAALIYFSKGHLFSVSAN